MKSRGAVALFVTFAQPCAGIPDVGSVIASSERLTATRPSVGGVRFDLELADVEGLDHAVGDVRFAVRRRDEAQQPVVPGRAAW